MGIPHWPFFSRFVHGVRLKSEEEEEKKKCLQSLAQPPHPSFSSPPPSVFWNLADCVTTSSEP